MSFIYKHSSIIFRLGASLGLGLLLTLIAISTIHAQKPGDLDPTFNNTGIVTTTIGGDWQWGIDVALQSDEKIIVVGEHGVFTDVNDLVNFAVFRYTVTGMLDSTFNNTGFITTAIADWTVPRSVAIQPDDKIVVGGYSSRSSYPYISTFAVARYTVTGALDSTFNGTGTVTTLVSNENYPYDMAYSVALQPDGKIVVAGDSYSGWEGSRRDFAVVRYTPTGTLDSTFNFTGIVTTPITNEDDEARAVAVQPDGKIVVVGSSNIYNSDFTVVRYTITGALDSSFNNTGIVRTSIGDYASATSVAVQPDGKIVVVGNSEQDDIPAFTIVRYTPTGTLDSSFSHTGIVTNPSAFGEVRDMALQPDGKIVVVGEKTDIDNGSISGNYFAVVRYTTNGALDTSFNLTGIVTTSISGGHDEGVGVAIQPDGKILAVGIDGTEDGSDFAVTRYLNHWHTIIFVPVILKE